MKNTFTAPTTESLSVILERARVACDEGIIYINETPFAEANDITRILTLSKAAILKTSRGYITYNTKAAPRKSFYLIDYDYIDGLEIKENFGRDYMESRRAVIPTLKYSAEWQPIIDMYNTIMMRDCIGIIPKFSNGKIDLDHAIPKIIHFIYVVNPPPEAMKTRMKVWQAYHPDWTVKFWGDVEIAALGLVNQKQYDRSANPGEKSDIARYEILYREGGVYVDQDIDCLGNINIFNKICDFWCGCALDDYFTAFNGLIGSIPKHPLLKMLIGEISKLVKPAHNAEQVQHNTGPYLFSRMIKLYVARGGTPILVLPPTYFYPTTVRGGGSIQPESYGNHLWGRSWVSQKYGTINTTTLPAPTRPLFANKLLLLAKSKTKM